MSKSLSCSSAVMGLSLRAPVEELDGTQLETTRSTSSIVFTCLFTFLLCAWCCIRPNIPSPHDSKLRIWTTKLRILFYFFVSPELVACWSFRRWLEAGKIAEQFKCKTRSPIRLPLILPTDRGWTRRHALFLMMGGFVLTKDGLQMQTVSTRLFQRLVQQNAIDVPTMTTAGIQERSNLHPVLAYLALLQAVSFVVQCLSRVIRGLLITQLEVTTLTMVFSSAIVFPFIRQIPLDVRRPVLIPIHPQFYFDPLAYPTANIAAIRDDFRRENGMYRILKQIAAIDHPPQQYRPYPTLSLRNCLRFLIARPLSTLYWDFGELAVSLQSDELQPEDLRFSIPLFYLPYSGHPPPFSAILPVVCVLGMSVGVVHCLYWSWGHFPSSHARLLWGVSSAITAGFHVVCLIITIITTIIYPLCDLLPSYMVFDMLSLVFTLLCVGFLVVSIGPFVVARIILLVESFWCLKSLPQEAFEVIPWTRYIPHLS